MLAGHLGMTVGELGTKLSSTELTYWIEYYRLEPFGQLRDNLHAGMIASTIFNVNRGKGTSAVKPDDFLIKNKSQKQEDSVSAFVGFLHAAATDEQ